MTIGFSNRARLLVVCHGDRSPDRILNKSTRERRIAAERRYYESTEKA